MSKATKIHPERGDARTRLLEAARDEIRTKGFAATTVDELCKTAGVSKGAFFHHFAGKEALGVAAAEFWAETTSALFSAASYHERSDPLDRVLAYLEFRKAIISTDLASFTCLAGTMAQEVYESHPAIRDACAASIFGHAETLETDIAAAMRARGIGSIERPISWTSASLARHTQTVLQGAFVLAKAADNPSIALESIDHLILYVRLLFCPPGTTEPR